MANIKTTICGVLAAVFGVLGSQYPELNQVFIALTSLSTAAFGYFAADKKDSAPPAVANKPIPPATQGGNNATS